MKPVGVVSRSLYLYTTFYLGVFLFSVVYLERHGGLIEKDGFVERVTCGVTGGPRYMVRKYSF